MYKPEPLPPEYSPPVFKNSGYEYHGNSGAFGGPSEVMTPQQAHDAAPPPAYDAIFQNRVEPVESTKQPLENHDDRNNFVKCHEWLENSIIQQSSWLGVLAFAIFYIYKGLEHAGKCGKVKMGGQVEYGLEDIAVWMTIEGGVLCGFVMYVFLLRFLALLDRRRTTMIPRSEIDRRKKCGLFMFLLLFGLFITWAIMCYIGAKNIFTLYDKDNNDDINITVVVRCDDGFYHMYYYTKIGQLVVTGLFLISSTSFLMAFDKRNFLRRKIRFFAYLLDTDHDGVITPKDMKKTYEKLELIRKSLGDRKDAAKEDEMNALWNKHVFQTGSTNGIPVGGYALHLEGNYVPRGPNLEQHIRPFITGLFNAFSTEEFRKKNLILSAEDFVRFWEILAGVDPHHSKKYLFGILSILRPWPVS